MFTEAYLEPSQTSTTELFSLRSNHILKTLNSIELPFRFHFLHNTTFFTKTYNCENFGRKSLLLTVQLFFFEI